MAAYNRKRPETTEPAWVCGLPGTELMIVNCGVKSWKRQLSCRGTLHDDDDDDDDDDDGPKFTKFSSPNRG